jgi:hypothetical protein
LQVSGEAAYTDDIKLPSDAVSAALVTSTKPHARITYIDASKALEVSDWLPHLKGYIFHFTVCSLLMAKHLLVSLLYRTGTPT